MRNLALWWDSTEHKTNQNILFLQLIIYNLLIRKLNMVTTDEYHKHKIIKLNLTSEIHKNPLLSLMP